MTTESVHVRIPIEEVKTLKQLGETFGVSATSLAAMILRGGIKAIVANHNRVGMPCEFAVKSCSEEPVKPPIERFRR